VRPAEMPADLTMAANRCHISINDKYRLTVCLEPTRWERELQKQVLPPGLATKPSSLVRRKRPTQQGDRWHGSRTCRYTRVPGRAWCSAATVEGRAVTARASIDGPLCTAVAFAHLLRVSACSQTRRSPKAPGHWLRPSVRMADRAGRLAASALAMSVHDAAKASRPAGWYCRNAGQDCKRPAQCWVCAMQIAAARTPRWAASARSAHELQAFRRWPSLSTWKDQALALVWPHAGQAARRHEAAFHIPPQC
jgi:hypothetical protein